MGALDNKYKCLSCQGVSTRDVLDTLGQVLRYLHGQVRTNDLDIHNCILERAEKDTEVLETSGKIVSAISKEMKKLRITPEVFHGGIYTTITSIKWLENHKVFTSFIPDITIKEKWDDIIGLFYDISKKLMSTVPIKIEDRHILYNDLERLGDVWVKEVDHKISPKLDT